MVAGPGLDIALVNSVGRPLFFGGTHSFSLLPPPSNSHPNAQATGTGRRTKAPRNLSPLPVGVQTQSPPEFINVKALVTIAQIYKLPSIITTSAADGSNGPIMPVVAEGLPDATIVHRPGEINAWDNADFVAAVKKTGRPPYSCI